MLTKLQLKNGLKVLLFESHKSPVVSVQMWVRTGSADEKKPLEGISHFIEHLVFKGTKKFKVGEIASIIEGSGGELNAYTSFDQTVFHVTISKEFVDTGLDCISQMMGFPIFDKQEIDNEREVVCEEIKRGLDSPGRRASQLLFSTCYKKHPYGIPVIGFDKNIRKMSRKAIVDYFESRYVPSNMFLVVTGDFATKDMKKQVESYFGGFAPYKLKKVKRVKEPKQSQPRIALEKFTSPETSLYLSWPVPGVTHKDIPALDVLSFVLGQGDSSRLTKRLRIDAPIANSVGAFAYTPQDQGMLAISMSLNRAQVSEALRLVTAEIEGLFTQPPTNEEMRKAKVNVESEQYYSLETVDGISRKIGNSQFLMNDPMAFEAYLKQVKKLTAEDLLKVAKKYFDPKKISAVALTSDELAPLKKELQVWTKEFAKRAKTFKISKIKEKSSSKIGSAFKVAYGKNIPRTERLELNNGLKVLLRPIQDSAVVSTKLVLRGGNRIEPDNKEGLVELLSRVWISGTSHLSEGEIHIQTEEMASSLSAFSGRNTLGLTLDTLSPFFPKMLETFADVAINSLWSEQVLNREKAIMLEQIKARNDNPSQLAIQQFHRLMFSGHPYRKDVLGQESTVKSISRKDILDYWNRIAHPNNATLVVAGNFQRDQTIAFLEKSFASWKRDKDIKDLFDVSPLQKDLQERLAMVKEQTHIVVGYRGLTLKDKDRYALQIIQSVLAGQGGRLFLELRDKNSMAYSVAPLKMEGIDTGYFGAYIGCSPEKTDRAIEMLKHEFARLVDKPVDNEELTRAKRYLIGRHDIDLQRTSTVATSIVFDEVYGIDYDETFKVKEKYDSITPAEIQKVAQRILQPFCGLKSFFARFRLK